jgi:hypothetical protein
VRGATGPMPLGFAVSLCLLHSGADAQVRAAPRQRGCGFEFHFRHDRNRFPVRGATGPMPLGFAVSLCLLHSGADAQVRGPTPWPACSKERAGRGRPARTRGSAPPLFTSRKTKWRWATGPRRRLQFGPVVFDNCRCGAFVKARPAAMPTRPAGVPLATRVPGPRRQRAQTAGSRPCLPAVPGRYVGLRRHEEADRKGVSNPFR